MRFTPIAMVGAFIIDLEPHADERGFFARAWCRDEFADHGLDPRLAQCSISFNERRGTLRGMHFQVAPYAEAKVVRCTYGAIFDVIVDLRPQSSTFKRWFGVELTQENHRALYIPEGFAHGFQTQLDKSEVFYQMSESYRAESAQGVRWNDPEFGIDWPIKPPFISQRDAQFPDFQP